DVDDLADLLVAADDRVELAAAGLLGEVDGEALERLLLAHLRGRHRLAEFSRRRLRTELRAVARGESCLGRPGADLIEVVGELVRLDPVEFSRDPREQVL